MAALVDDVKTLFVDMGAYLNDETGDEVFESGPFKGNSKFFTHLGEASPGFSTGIRLYRTGQQVMD
jgi:hypothetical protein